jgi:hypothetical protein
VAQQVARLLDRRGAALPSTVSVADGLDSRGQPAIVVDLPLSAFAQSDYVLELNVTDATGTTSRSVVAFRVTR